MERVKIMVMGVGSTIRGDDGAGPEVASELESLSLPWVLAVDASTSPESFVGWVEEHRPEHLIIVDVADMGLRPGEVRRIPKEKIGGEFLSTHSLPLTVLWEMLEEAAGEVVLLGIQPYTTALGSEMSEPVKSAVRRVVELIAEGRWGEVEELS
ncbi:MAG: hydrogenase 3 maturation endopeptidase HyCI [Thermoplasmata archaeon]|nr:MAG: hydrogenase 3 maturation endopeptidase HyCI [Thermoplasmata archaeon]